MSIYDSFGIPVVINACGPVTRLGGAPMPADVKMAFQQAASGAVSLEQLQGAACERIAGATGAEAGLVTAGAAAGLTLGAAAILCGRDLGRIERLPDCRGFRNQFIVAREHRSGYDHAVRATGARLVEVGFNEIVSGAGVRRTETWEYQAAFSDRTAGVLYVKTKHSAPPLAEVAEAAHAAGLPVLVDAAGELPPRTNLKTMIADGADLVAFSGGKAICGPQSTGLLCGRRDLIASAAMQMLDMDDHIELWDPPPRLIEKSDWPAMPRHGIGRALKVSKEEIVAVLMALEHFAAGEYDAELPRMQEVLTQIAAALAGLPVEVTMTPSCDGCPPLLTVQMLAPTPEAAREKAFTICRQLRSGAPPIYLGHGQLDRGRLGVNPMCFQPGESEVVAERLIAAIGQLG